MRAATVAARVIVAASLLAAGACSGSEDASEPPTATSPPPGPSGSAGGRGDRSRATDLVTVYGAAGTFGSLADAGGGGGGGGGGESVRTVDVPGFAFAPGASAAFAAVSHHGRVVIGTFPQTNNQVDPVGTSMTVTVVDPDVPAAGTVAVPTTAGLIDAGMGSPPIGGADVSDVCAWDTARGPRLVGVSVSPDKGWPRAQGVFPSVVAFEDRGGRGAAAVVRDPAGDRTADALATSPTGEQAVPAGVGPDGTAARTAQGLNECDVAPNGDLLVTQYLPEGSRSGGVVALDPSAVVVATYVPPERSSTGELAVVHTDGQVRRIPAGTPLVLSAREVQADPSHGDPADQRLLVVYDVSARLPTGGGLDGGAPLDVSLPNVFQELRYDAPARHIEAHTDLLVLRDPQPGSAPNDLVRGSTGVYGPDGTLFLTTTHAESTASGPLAIFLRNRMVAAPTGTSAIARTVTPELLADGFDAGTEPDHVVATATGAATPASFASAFALTYDEDHDRVLAVGLSGTLRAMAWDRGARRLGATCEVDLGGHALAAANAPAAYLPRQGAVDRARGTWFVPVQGTLSGGARTVGATIPQFLWAIGLDPLAERCAR